MPDIFDYLSWRGDLTMDKVPPGPVDTLILSELCYIGFEGLINDDFRHPVPLRLANQVFQTLPDRADRGRVR